MSERPTVLMLTKMHESGMAILREAVDLRTASALDPATLTREAADVDGIIIRTQGEVDARLLDAAKRLKVVGRHGVGYDHIDIQAATERGVLVVTTPGANIESVCEHAFAFMIGMSKWFPQTMEALRAGDYLARTKWTGRDLLGRTLGIIGFGRIGRRVGEVAHRAFGMKVIYNDIVEPPAEAVERAGGARGVSLDELLRTAEYVSLHVPLDETTRGMIDGAAIEKMRTDAILINTCRGPVVVERAIADALDAKRIWGYAADVYEVEPPPANHPLIGRPDCMLTPHSAAQTEESLRNMSTGVARDVVGVLRGERPLNPVNDPELVARNRRRLGRDSVSSNPGGGTRGN